MILITLTIGFLIPEQFKMLVIGHVGPTRLRLFLPAYGWRNNRCALLNEIKTSKLSLVNHDKTTGTVGTTGNAAGKSPHLHYSIATLIPYLWRIDGSPQGW